MVPGYSEKWMSIGFGIRIPDVVLVSMLGAAIVKVILSNRKQYIQNNLGVSAYIILFGLWISFEVARNINIYGLSAPGEFRYRYLILSAPLYIAVFFTSSERRKKLLKLLIASSLFFPIMCVPIIGQIKGWSIGPEARFFHASISLGLIYGLIALSLGKKYNVIRINAIFFWSAIIAIGFLIIIDSHRSVWLASVAVGAILFLIREIDYKKMMNHALIITVSGLIIFILAQQVIVISLKTNLVDFVFERASEIIKIDESYKNNVSWRMVQWKTQMAKFYASPIIGEGFGGYWGLSGMQGDLGVQPHNLYVQTLVKLGIVGMLFYTIIIVKLFFRFISSLKRYKVKGDTDMPILIIGIVVLTASHVFYVAYPFEYYSLLFIGLGISSLKSNKYSKNV
jgi:O-antigen ligase